ncbi:MAG: hypothetical protein FWE97_04135, partial [Dehalococcoidia bacterium]|nr:hypothetical protein [Dehalococcoidia bacterium]
MTKNRTSRRLVNRIKGHFLTLVMLFCAIALMAQNGSFFAPKLAQASGIGTDYGPHVITDVLPDGDVTISAADKVYEVNGGSGIISVKADTVLVLNGTNRSGNVSQLQILDNATAILYLVDGSENSFICTGVSTSQNAVQAGIYVQFGATLIIEGEGKLSSTGGRYSAGIGGICTTNTNEYEQGTGVHISIPCGTIRIESGTVTAVGGNGGAGIGGGAYGRGGNIIINGGIVNSSSSGAGVYATLGGAGIGGGGRAPSGHITINGGEVIAYSANAGAGIGGGAQHRTSDLLEDIITITNGKITTTTQNNGGTGIGAGAASHCGTVNISGGLIYALGSAGAAGIGNGIDRSGGVINISGGIIYARNQNNDGVSGVGGGGGTAAYVVITSGNILSLTRDEQNVRINYTPKNEFGEDVFMIGLKVLDERERSIIPFAEVEMIVGTSPNTYTYTATANELGMAYLWLPVTGSASYYDYCIVDSVSGTYSDGTMTVNKPSNTVEYPVATSFKEYEMKSNSPVVALTVTPGTKIYNDTVLLDLKILHDNVGSHPDKAIAGVMWFRESVSHQLHIFDTHGSFEAGYDVTDPANRGEGGVGESLNLYFNPDKDTHHYSMAVDKNGRYWIQVKYISANVGIEVYYVFHVDIVNIYTVIGVYVQDWDTDDNVQLKDYSLI